MTSSQTIRFLKNLQIKGGKCSKPRDDHRVCMYVQSHWLCDMRKDKDNWRNNPTEALKGVANLMYNWQSGPWQDWSAGTEISNLGQSDTDGAWILGLFIKSPQVSHCETEHPENRLENVCFFLLHIDDDGIILYPQHERVLQKGFLREDRSNSPQPDCHIQVHLSSLFQWALLCSHHQFGISLHFSINA
jgi:hypothetical protein